MGNTDEMVELVHFSEIIQDYCEVEENAGSLVLKIRNNKTSQFGEFCVGEKLCNQDILNQFKLQTLKAMCRVNHSVNGHI